MTTGMTGSAPMGDTETSNGPEGGFTIACSVNITLKPPYDGPFLVMESTDETCVFDVQ